MIYITALHNLHKQNFLVLFLLDFYDFLLVFIAKAFIFSSVIIKELLTLEYFLSKIRSVVRKRGF